MTVPYVSGTVSVTAGSAVVTGVGTGWATALLTGGMFGLDSANGNPVPIASVDSNTQLTLAKPWRGTTAATQAYWIMRDTAYGQQTVANATALAQIINELRSPALAAFAGLSPAADKIPYFSSASAAALADLGAKGRDVAAAKNLADLLNELGPVVGGPAPIPSLAEVGLADGNFNAINVPGAFTIAGSWSNGPRGAALTGYNGLLLVYARQYNNGYWQILYLNDGNTYQRYTSTTDAATWPGAWERMPQLSTNNTWTGTQSLDAGGAYVAWALSRNGMNGVLEALAVGAMQLAVSTNHPLLFRTNNIERMRISETGDFLVGTDTAISPTSGSNSGHYFVGNGRYHRRSDGYQPFIQSRLSSGGSIQEFYQGTTQVGVINVSSTATSYGTSSDYRLKENVEPLVTFNLTAEQFDLLDDSLLRVMTYEPVSYTWKRTGERDHGFIAHVLQQVAPHAVSGDKDEMRDLGTITIPAHTVEVEDPETGEKSLRDVPEQKIPDAYQDDTPEGATWERTHDEPAYQAVDSSKLIADLTAAVQSLTMLVLEQRSALAEMDRRIPTSSQ